MWQMMMQALANSHSPSSPSPVNRADYPDSPATTQLKAQQAALAEQKNAFVPGADDPSQALWFGHSNTPGGMVMEDRARMMEDPQWGHMNNQNPQNVDYYGDAQTDPRVEAAWAMTQTQAPPNPNQITAATPDPLMYGERPIPGLPPEAPMAADKPTAPDWATNWDANPTTPQPSTVQGVVPWEAFQ